MHAMAATLAPVKKCRFMSRPPVWPGGYTRKRAPLRAVPRSSVKFSLIAVVTGEVPAQQAEGARYSKIGFVGVGRFRILPRVIFAAVFRARRFRPSAGGAAINHAR